MPGKFTEEEMKKIKTGLLEEGRRLFTLYGLKKTTINEITKAVSIAQGSFYKFYNSKEELYFEIIDIEGQKMRKALARDLKLVDSKPKEGIKKLLLDSFQLFEENELFKDLFSGNNYNTLLRKLPKERIEEHIDTDFAVISPLIEKWQTQGILKKESPGAITGILHALFFISLHKNEMSVSIYDETFKLLVDLIVEGLVKS